jgi:hypothetical protein
MSDASLPHAHPKDDFFFRDLARTPLRNVGGLRQLPGASRTEDRHDTETTVEENHGVCDKTPH